MGRPHKLQELEIVDVTLSHAVCCRSVKFVVFV